MSKKLSQAQANALLALLENEGEALDDASRREHLATNTVNSLVRAGLVSIEHFIITVTEAGIAAIRALDPTDFGFNPEDDLVDYFRHERMPRPGEMVEWQDSKEVDGKRVRLTGRAVRVLSNNYTRESAVWEVAIATATVPIFLNTTLYAHVQGSDLRVCPKHLSGS